MKPTTPLPGFNTRPLGRVPTTCCGCFSRDTKRTPFGTWYCAECLESARRYARRDEAVDAREVVV